jgi:RNA polymerase sigma factor (sigma-70 family)
MMMSVMSVPFDGRAGGTEAGVDALAVLHQEHYRSLVRLAVLVLGDVGLSEQVVQDAFVRLQLRWGGLRDIDRAPVYLRSAVLNGARSQLRRQKVRDRFAGRRTVKHLPPTPESAALAHDDQARVITALRHLSGRQCEALTLRYYLELSETEIAATMGIAPGSVKTHLRRGLANLADVLTEDSHDR